MTKTSPLVLEQHNWKCTSTPPRPWGQAYRPAGGLIMASNAQRRLSVLAQQLSANPDADMACEAVAPLQRAPTAAPGPSQPTASSSTSSTHASVTGEPSSYAKVHGTPSRAAAVWRRVPALAGKQLEDVKYDKAMGEGIAKVRARLEDARTTHTHTHTHTAVLYWSG